MSFSANRLETFIQNISPSIKDPVTNVKKLMKSRTCSFSLRPVYPDEVEKIMNRMKSSKSCGLDNIDSYVIKLASKELTPVITHIINISIQHQMEIFKNNSTP
jgi:replication-associated recombination protein RarA